jgi:hypothetical protein
MEKKHRTSASPHLAPMFDGGHSPSGLMNKPYNGGNNVLTSSSAAAPAPTMAQMFRSTAGSVASLSSTTSTEEDGTSLYHLKGANPMLASSTHALLNANSTTMSTIPIDELSRAIGSYNNQGNNPNEQPLPSQGPLIPFPGMEKIWDWNPLLESPKVCTSFK